MQERRYVFLFSLFERYMSTQVLFHVTGNKRFLARVARADPPNASRSRVACVVVIAYSSHMGRCIRRVRIVPRLAAVPSVGCNPCIGGL